MSLIVLASDKGSPGVTTTAVALAGVWPRRAILAECDPAGGDLVYRTPAESGAPLNPNIGMLSLATTARHGLSAHQLEQHVQRMHGGLELVVGLATGDQSAGLAGLWPTLGRAFDARAGRRRDRGLRPRRRRRPGPGTDVGRHRRGAGRAHLGGADRARPRPRAVAGAARRRRHRDGRRRAGRADRRGADRRPETADPRHGAGGRAAAEQRPAGEGDRDDRRRPGRRGPDQRPRTRAAGPDAADPVDARGRAGLVAAVLGSLRRGL